MVKPLLDNRKLGSKPQLSNEYIEYMVCMGYNDHIVEVGGYVPMRDAQTNNLREALLKKNG